MNKEKETKADPHDHNDHLPKDVLNLEQDPNSFVDPLEQQLGKDNTNNMNDTNNNPNNESNK